jgi:hypothetical protein
MKWFRGKIRRGTSLALLALAINLALSFGHVHLDGLKGLNLEGLRGAEATAGILLSAITHRDSALTSETPCAGKTAETPASKHDGHPDDLCPICMAQAALGTGLAAAAPVLPIDLASIEIDPVVSAEQAIPQRPRAGFQSRGPPLS